MLGDRHVNPREAFCIDELHFLFAAVIHGFEAQTSPIKVWVLRSLFGRHLCKFVGEFHPLSLFNFRWPQCALARGTKLLNTAAVQCPRDADARHSDKIVE
jgi:hypothetical protein